MKVTVIGTECSLVFGAQAIKRDPTNAAYRNNLAAALTKIGDFNAAKAACEKVRTLLASDPSGAALVWA